MLAVAAAAAAGAAPDIERGRSLYENHCIGCHGRQVHGRPGRAPPTPAELRQIVVRWEGAEGLQWSEDESADVTAYLQRVVYGGTRTGRR